MLNLSSRKPDLSKISVSNISYRYDRLFHLARYLFRYVNDIYLWLYVIFHTVFLVYCNTKWYFHWVEVSYRYYRWLDIARDLFRYLKFIYLRLLIIYCFKKSIFPWIEDCYRFYRYFRYLKFIYMSWYIISIHYYLSAVSKKDYRK